MSTNGQLNNPHPYIVGIGASAGGMEAIHDVFDYMPDNTGFAFVVIQHLSPDYKSLMAELLTRHTSMQVVEASDGLSVTPNCIYVIPSKKLMTIRHGQLQLDEKLKTRQPNNAIDIFFDSLAEDVGKNAIGIILSGTGTDGTKGIESIKAHGGLVLVQDPLSAAFDGMPNSAVASGFADLIIPPEMMGEELLDYIKEAPLMKSLSKLNQKEELLLRDILEMLNEATHQDFSLYKRPTLFRRLAKRMSEVGVPAIQDYKNYLLEHSDELKILGKEFLINVTKFFRDKEAFDSLRLEAIPSLLEKKRTTDPVKVWVVACSSGEEAYSVAMLFLDQMHRTQKYLPNLKIFATDIDSDSLEFASKGCYTSSIEKEVPAEFLSKYFVKEGKGYRVTTALRKQVVFANHDILKDPPFSHLDLITCRNMFIYMNSTLQRKILKKFHFALDIDSFLMLGPSENIGILKDAMKEVSRKWKLYKCTSKASVFEQDTLLSPLHDRIAMQMATSTPNKKSTNAHIAEIFKETILEERKLAAVIIDRDFNVKHAIGNYKNFIQFPDDHFNFNILKLVPADLSIALGIIVRKAISENQRATMKRVVVHSEEGERSISLTVKPYIQQKEFQQPFLCVIIEEDASEPKGIRTVEYDSISSSERITELEEELAGTRENLQAVIEEMETANEELQSNNEEMISSNEELQSTNEELQSLNEELHTVSAEHQLKIKELIELNDDLNNYFTNSEIGQILVDKKLVTRKYSPAATRMVNLIQTDLGRSLMDISNNIKDEHFIDDIKHVIKTSEPIEKEISLHDDHFYILRITPFMRRDRIVDGAVINFIDISEHKKISSILNGVFQSSTSAITAQRAIRNKEGVIVDFEFLIANTTSEYFFNTKANWLPGKKMTDVFPELAKDFLPPYAEVVNSGKTTSFEYFNKSSKKWLLVTAVKMLDGVVTTHNDITDQKESESVIARNYENLRVTSQQLEDTNTQLERSNYDLLQFASIASHDLKEPLRKIQAFGNILQTKIKDKLIPEEQNYFAKMISASGRMQTLIEDVLTLSKLSNNTVSKDDVDLVGVIKRICEDLEITINDKKAKIIIGTLPIVHAVPGQMRQLFQNLISNSLKFSDRAESTPVITIEQKAIPDFLLTELKVDPNDFLCISVMDNGIGFENEYNEKIFGIFQRLHGRNFEGTGIGLAIAKKIIENHAGYITARGELNVGAEFFILLPKNE